MKTFLFHILLMFPAVCAAGPIDSTPAERSSLAGALEKAGSIPAFQASVLSRISIVASASFQDAPTLSQSAAPGDKYPAEAAALVGALVAQPEAAARYSSEISAAFGDRAAAQLKEATARIQARAAERPELAAELENFRREIDFDDAGALQRTSALLNVLFENSRPRNDPGPIVQAAPDPTLGRKTMPAAWTLQPAAAAASLPATQYVASIQTDASGQKSLWLRVPASANDPQGQFYSLGPISTVKAGTLLFHWENQPDQILSAGKVSEDRLDQSILQSSTSPDDLWGGGFYMSTSLADSASFGARGIYTVLGQDIQAVTTYALPPTERLDMILAIKNAGIDAFQESPHPSWFNIVQPQPLSAGFKEIDFPTAIRALRAETPPQASVDLLLFDQRYPVALAAWPSDLCAPLRNLLAGQSLSDQDRAALSGAYPAVAVLFMLMKVRSGGTLKTTPLFNAFDGFVKQTQGVSLLGI